MSSEAHQIAVVLTHSGAGILSVCGSGLIFTSLMVQSWRNQKRFRPFQRLLLGLSIYDLMHSLAVSFTTLPVRADADVWGAKGTVATCTAQVFFQQQAQAGFIYNSALLFSRHTIRPKRQSDCSIRKVLSHYHLCWIRSIGRNRSFLQLVQPMWFPELGCWFGT
jgi:hypothetical protein